MATLNSRKKYKTSDVIKALNSSEFDDLPVDELDDITTDDEEPLSGDVIMDDNIVNLSEGMIPGSVRIDPCYRDSVLLSDEELVEPVRIFNLI